jgi:hypothetical protein
VATLSVLRAQGHPLRTLPQSLDEFWVAATPIATNGLGLSVAECTPTLAGIKTIFPLLPGNIEAAIKELFVLIGGRDFTTHVIAGIVKEVLERRFGWSYGVGGGAGASVAGSRTVIPG